MRSLRAVFPSDYNVLEFSGRDARQFLHAQLATDLRKHAPGAAPHAALLAANGRVLAAGTLIVASDEQFWWLLDRELIDAVAAHLSRYRLRSKLLLQSRPDLHLCATAADSPQFVDAVERRFALSAAPDAALEPEQFAARAIKLGMLDFAAEHADRHLPQALGLHRHGAIALDKGCYPGQEIVARTHYLGRVKRALARFRSTAAPLPEQLQGVGGKSIGELLNLLHDGKDYIGLATLQTDAYAQQEREAGVALGFELEFLD